VALDGGGNLYVEDRQSEVIRKITPEGVVTTLAGLADNGGTSDGVGSDAMFNDGYGVAADSAGNIYVADTGNLEIRKGSPAVPVITSPTVSSGTVGQLFVYQFGYSRDYTDSRSFAGGLDLR
jgi:hypothetical protein